MEKWMKWQHKPERKTSKSLPEAIRVPGTWKESNFEECFNKKPSIHQLLICILMFTLWNSYEETKPTRESDRQFVKLLIKHSICISVHGIFNFMYFIKLLFHFNENVWHIWVCRVACTPHCCMDEIHSNSEMKRRKQNNKFMFSNKDPLKFL